MMRRLGLVAGLLLLVGGLAACKITITYSPPTDYTSVVANSSGSITTRPPALDTVTIPSHQTVYYQIDTTGITSYPLLYVELDQSINLELQDAGGVPISSAHNNLYFAGEGLGLASLAGASVSPLDITAPFSCAGSCVIKKRTSSTYYAALTNNTSASVTVNFYAYGSTYDDSEEPQNNDPSTTLAQLTTGTSTHDGALETLGDVDYWYVPLSAGGYWNFTATSTAIDIAACPVNTADNCTSGPFYDGQTIHVVGGDYVKVYATNGRAGVADASQYTFGSYTP